MSETTPIGSNQPTPNKPQGSIRQDVIKPLSREASEQDVRGELAKKMMRPLSSPNAVTVQYYIPGKSEPSIEREGADWENEAARGRDRLRWLLTASPR